MSKFKVGDRVVVNCSSVDFDGEEGILEEELPNGVCRVKMSDGILSMPNYYLRLKEEVTTRPSHYSKHTIEPIDLIVALGIGEAFCAGNVIKYVSRYSDKNGDADLAKAEQYLKWLIQLNKTGRIEK